MLKPLHPNTTLTPRPYLHRIGCRALPVLPFPPFEAKHRCIEGRRAALPARPLITRRPVLGAGRGSGSGRLHIHIHSHFRL